MLHNIRTTAAAVLVTATLTSPASATVYNYVLEWSGGQFGDVVLDFNLDSDVLVYGTDATQGLTVNNISPTFSGEIGYDYHSSGNFTIGGLEDGVSSIATNVIDFFAVLRLFFDPADATALYAADSLASETGYGFASNPSITMSIVADTTPVPLPAALPLSMASLGALACLARRGRRS